MDVANQAAEIADRCVQRTVGLQLASAPVAITTTSRPRRSRARNCSNRMELVSAHCKSSMTSTNGALVAAADASASATASNRANRASGSSEAANSAGVALSNWRHGQNAGAPSPCQQLAQRTS